MVSRVDMTNTISHLTPPTKVDVGVDKILTKEEFPVPPATYHIEAVDAVCWLKADRGFV